MKKFFKGAVITILFCAVSAFAGAELSDSEWQAMKEAAKNRERKIIVDNDLDDFNLRIEGNEPTIEEVMARRTSFMHKYPVDAITVNLNGSTFQCHVPSKYGFFDEFFPNQTMTSLLVNKYNTDVMKVQLEYGKKHGIEIFAGFRINDTHDEAHSPEKPYPYFSKYKQNNPHLLCGWYDNRTRYVTWSSYDFAHKEIRDRFVNMVTEIAGNYEIDGIFIDLYRWLGLFKTVTTGKEATAKERQMFSEMILQIRSNLEEIGRKRQKPILFAIRVPDSVGYSRGIGFDWEYLMQKNAFDIVMVADNHHLTNWGKSIELCHKYGVKCYPSISMPCFMNLPRLSRHDPKSYVAREAGAWAAGADGIFFYNVFGEGSIKRVVFSEKDIYKMDKRYHITGMVHWRTTHNLATGEKYNELPELSPITPKILQAGQSRTFKLEFGDDLKKLRSEGVPVRTEATLIADTVDADSIEISSNNVKWIYKGSSQDNHFFTVPDEALRPGCNDVVFRSKVRSNELIRKEIMSGREILLGANQLPWRRIFRGNTANQKPESIVDKAYCFNDIGKGFVNFVYPFDESDKNIEINFELKAEDTTSPLGASMRVAVNNKVEIITFGNDKVGLYYAGKSVPFKTSEFHNYTVKFNSLRNVVEVFADGKKIMNGPVTKYSQKTALQGVIVAVPEAENKSMIIGSNDDDGKGKSYWRNVSISRQAGASVLKDMAVDVYLTPPPKASEMTNWDYEDKEVEKLAPGIYPYKDSLMIAEAEIDLDKAPYEVYVSNGGMMTSFKVAENGIEFRGGVRGILLGKMEVPCKIRMEIQDLTGKVFVGDTFVDIPLYNVSGELKSNQTVINVNNANDNIIRNSGVLVLSADKKGIKALRVKMFAPPDEVAKAKKALHMNRPVPTGSELLAVFSGAEIAGKLNFKNNYPAGMFKVDGSKLYLNHGENGKVSYAGFTMIDKNMLTFDSPVLLKLKLKMLKFPQGHSGTVQLGVAVGKEKVRSASIFIAPGKIILGGYGTFLINALQLDRDHEVVLLFDPRNGEHTLWVDGKTYVNHNQVLDSKNGNSLFIGDGAGAVAGEAVVEKLEIYKM